MKVLKVIHGYPNRYNAGSEVYSQMLCQGLVAQGHEVVVFTRQEDPYQREYSVEFDVDPTCEAIRLCLVNMAHSRDGYRHEAVDRVFRSLLEEYEPDVVHFGHLNHLSTSLIEVASEKGLPIVFTLHDFWLMCPRGQFLQAINSKGDDLYPACEGQENRKCARQCYWRYFSCQNNREDEDYWTGWVGKRMEHVQQMAELVDLFIAPSRYLMERFVKEFGVEESKMVYLDYGFHRQRLVDRKRVEGEKFVFGYIGTHKQAKGIHHLIEAFEGLGGGAELKIWGGSIAPFTQSLQSRAGEGVHWMGPYQNEKIVSDVFNHVDAIVVPSIWGENSPLVIHEALEVGVPVITANYGGMREYIQHEVNGLLFQHRNPKDLRMQMERFVKDPSFAQRLAQRGYLNSSDGRIPDIAQHVVNVESLYCSIMEKKNGQETRSLAHHL